MLNVTTIIDATTVVAVINAKITVVAACVRGVARKLKKRLDFGLFGKHSHPSWQPEYSRYPGDQPPMQSLCGKMLTFMGMESLGLGNEQSCRPTSLFSVQ